jgi:hypothetical protein
MLELEIFVVEYSLTPEIGASHFFYLRDIYQRQS